MLIPCAILWLLQQFAGAEATPFYTRWPTPERHIALGLQFFVWGALLYWVLWRGGADTLSDYVSLAQGERSSFYGPAAFQAGAIAAVLVGILGLFAAPGA
jgi:hypothetical protein